MSSQGAAQSLVPLLNSARGKVPDAKQASTPVNVKATAGLRMLGETEASAILQSTRSLLQASPFHFNPSDGVEIMGGLDEGACRAAGYLLFLPMLYFGFRPPHVPPCFALS